MSESVLETFGLQNATMVYYFCLVLLKVFCWMLSVSKTCKGHIVYSLKKDWHNPKLLESCPDEVIRSKFKKKFILKLGQTFRLVWPRGRYRVEFYCNESKERGWRNWCSSQGPRVNG